MKVNLQRSVFPHVVKRSAVPAIPWRTAIHNARLSIPPTGPMRRFVRTIEVGVRTRLNIRFKNACFLDCRTTSWASFHTGAQRFVDGEDIPRGPLGPLRARARLTATDAEQCRHRRGPVLPPDQATEGSPNRPPTSDSTLPAAAVCLLRRSGPPNGNGDQRLARGRSFPDASNYRRSTTTHTEVLLIHGVAQFLRRESRCP